MRRMVVTSVNQGIFDYSDASGWLLQPRRQAAVARSEALKKLLVKPQLYELWEEKQKNVPEMDACEPDSGLNLKSTEEKSYRSDNLGEYNQAYWHHITPVSARLQVSTYESRCPQLYSLPLDRQLAYLYRARQDLCGNLWKRYIQRPKPTAKLQDVDYSSPESGLQPSIIQPTAAMHVAVLITMPSSRQPLSPSNENGEDVDNSKVILGTSSMAWSSALNFETEARDNFFPR